MWAPRLPHSSEVGAPLVETPSCLPQHPRSRWYSNGLRFQELFAPMAEAQFLILREPNSTWPPDRDGIPTV